MKTHVKHKGHKEYESSLCVLCIRVAALYLCVKMRFLLIAFLMPAYWELCLQ